MSKVWKTYNGTCIVVGGTEKLDALDVVAKEMEFDRLEA